MGFKELPNIQKGGIVGFIITLIITIPLSIYQSILVDPGQGLIFNLLFFSTLLGIPFVIIGSIVGTVIDKRRDRNQKSSSDSAQESNKMSRPLRYGVYSLSIPIILILLIIILYSDNMGLLWVLPVIASVIPIFIVAFIIGKIADKIKSTKQ